MSHLDERNRLCTFLDLKNAQLLHFNCIQACLRAGFGPHLQAFNVVTTLSVHDFVESHTPKLQTLPVASSPLSTRRGLCD